jgi:hypothetical protein
VYCGILRDAYEAFAMYCFGRYITACLGELCLLKNMSYRRHGSPVFITCNSFLYLWTYI